MFIQYNGTNVHALGLVNTANLKMNQSPQEVRGLQPGWNELPKVYWEQNKDHPTIKNMVKRSTIVILPDVVVVKAKDKKTGKVVKKKVQIGLFDVPLKLTLFDEKRAVEIVKGTFVRDILQRWEDEETRIKVRKALARQLEPLLKTESEDDEGSGDDDEEAEEYYE